jgi:hypothetical protein
MARVRWQGHEFNAEPVRQIDDTSWLMVAKGHGPRFAPGTEIHVKTSEIIEMAAAEMPGEGLADLDRAMAKERETLPPVSELLAQAKVLRHDAPDKGVTNRNKPSQVTLGDGHGGPG